MSLLASLPMYAAIERNESQRVATFASQDPTTKMNVAYFQRMASTLTTPQALLKNYRALQVVLGAYNLTSRQSQTGLLQQLLTQNPQSKTSLAYTLGDQNAWNMANALGNWTSPSTSPLNSSATVATIVANYEQNQYEASQGKQIPGMQQALYFTRTIGNITTIPEVIADSSLMTVVEGALNLPTSFGELDYDRQVAILTKDLNLSKFSDPGYANQFVQRYLANKEASSTKTSPLVGLFSSSSSSGGDSILSTALGSTVSSSSSAGSILNIISTSMGSSSSSDSGSVLSLFA